MPGGLSCLSKYYRGHPEQGDGGWRWRLPDATSLQWDGGKVKTAADRGYYWRWAIPRYPIRWKNKVPQAIVDAFEAEGFIWGGRWLHYDTMHFEYRPELLDPDCRARQPPGADGGIGNTP